MSKEISPNIDPISKTPRRPRNNSSLFKYFILCFVIFLVGYGGFKAYTSFFTSSNPIESSNPLETKLEEKRKDLFLLFSEAQKQLAI